MASSTSQAARRTLRNGRLDVIVGMAFSNLIMYFIILCTGSTLYPAGKHEIETAAQAAEALRPLAGDAAGVLFAAGIIAVGFLAVPVMTAGAAYDLVQSLGWRHSLHAKFHEARGFYLTIAAVTVVAVGLNFIGFNPMNNGDVIIISVPPLTEERRRDLVKQAKAEAEDAKVSIRNARQEANKEIKKLEKEGASEDLCKSAEADVQELTNSFVKKVDELLAQKEAEIMKV